MNNAKGLDQNDKILLGFVIGFLLFCGWYFFFAQEASNVNGPVDVGGGSIVIEDQYDVEKVTLDAELVAPGHITIHRTMSEAPAEIVGVSRLLDVGVHEGVIIGMNVPLDVGYRYVAILHVDDGDEVFEPLEDMPVEVNGEVVRPDFVVLDNSDSADEIAQ